MAGLDVADDVAGGADGRRGLTIAAIAAVLVLAVLVLLIDPGVLAARAQIFFWHRIQHDGCYMTVGPDAVTYAVEQLRKGGPAAGSYAVDLRECLELRGVPPG